MADPRNEGFEPRRESRRFQGYGYDDERRTRRDSGGDDDGGGAGWGALRNFALGEGRDFDRDYERDGGRRERRDERRSSSRDQQRDFGRGEGRDFGERRGGGRGYGREERRDVGRPFERDLDRLADRDYGGDYARLPDRDVGRDFRREFGRGGERDDREYSRGGERDDRDFRRSGERDTGRDFRLDRGRSGERDAFASGRDEGPDGGRFDDARDRAASFRDDRRELREPRRSEPRREGSGRWDFGRSYGSDDRPRFGRRDDRYGTNQYTSGRDAGLYGYGRDTDYADLDRWQRESRRFEQAQREAGRGQHAGKGPQGYRKSDARITEQVCEALSEAADVDAREIEVKVESGEVTLSGNVDHRLTKRRAEEVAEGVAGVRDVQNLLRIKARGRPD